MERTSTVAIGWDQLGDLGWVEKNCESKDELKRRIGELVHYSNAPHVASRNAGEIFDFAAVMVEDDLVLPAIIELFRTVLH